MEKLKEFAEKLTKECKYRDIPQKLIDEAKEKGIVIVYGASDDLMEFDGAIYDEFDCFEGGTCYLNEKGLFESECEDEYCPYAQKEKQNCKTVEAIWCEKNTEWAWIYKTDIPHETFEMTEDGEKYCLGIIFYKEELKK